MIKVLQYPAPGFQGGGVPQYILNNLKFIDKSKYQFDFLTHKEKYFSHKDKYERLYGKLHYITCSQEENEDRFISEFNAILDEGYDAFHLHTSFWRGYMLEEIAVKRKVPVIIVHSHSTSVDIKENEDRIKALEIHEKLKYSFDENLATHFCACSKAAADWLFGDQIPRDRIRILNNAIDTDKFSYKLSIREKYRKDLDVEDSFVIGHIGNFRYQKNHDLLIDIFNLACKKVPNAKLLLIGKGELREVIEKKVSDYGLYEKVIFLGYRTDAAELLQAMDVFVLPSRFEGFGFVLAEAQCAGLKCLASEYVPVNAKITYNLDYLPCDAKSWADRIAEIANNPYERVDMSEEIREAGYSIREQIKILEKIYSNEL